MKRFALSVFSLIFSAFLILIDGMSRLLFRRKSIVYALILGQLNASVMVVAMPGGSEADDFEVRHQFSISRTFFEGKDRGLSKFSVSYRNSDEGSTTNPVNYSIDFGAKFSEVTMDAHGILGLKDGIGYKICVPDIPGLTLTLLWDGIVRVETTQDDISESFSISIAGAVAEIGNIKAKNTHIIAPQVQVKGSLEAERVNFQTVMATVVDKDAFIKAREIVQQGPGIQNNGTISPHPDLASEILMRSKGGGIFNNSGPISGGKINLNFDKSVNLEGGKIISGDTLGISGQNILNHGNL